MISVTAGIASIIDELLGVLDEEIALLQRRKSQMGRLCEAIVERDDDTMERLLAEMSETQQLQEHVDLKLLAHRNTVANAVGRAPGEMKLSVLIAELPPSHRPAVDYRRQQIVLLIQDVRRQHLDTALLLGECARINHMLLTGMFPAASEVTTYDHDGPDTWRSDTGLVDAEL